MAVVSDIPDAAQLRFEEMDALKAPLASEVELLATSDNSDDEPVSSSTWIVSSPYQQQAHQLDLDTLSNENADFAKALQSMTATRDDYATAEYQSAFNWDAIVSSYLQISSTRHTRPSRMSFYVIVFRSRLKPDAERTLLGTLDKAAHLEAVEAGGLLKYWFGSPDADRRNLATCLWRARSDARLGGAGPGHAAAMLAARRMYDEWFVERLELSISLREQTWSFTPWQDSE